MEAKFTEQQPPVRWQELGNGLVDVTICLNEKTVTEAIEDGEDHQEALEYEYDFNQFREKIDNISRQDVEDNPEKYLDYEPLKEPVVEELQEQIQILKVQNNDLEQQVTETQIVLCEVVELLTGGA